MNNLSTYVSAIKNGSRDGFIVSSDYVDLSYQDEEISVECSECYFHFSNGAVIKQTLEQDMDESPADVVCAECWISYQVVSAPDDLSIRPQTKSFINRCQESFWLKMTASQGASS